MMSDLSTVLLGDVNDGGDRVPALRSGVVTQASPLLVRVGSSTVAAPARALVSYVPVAGDSVAVLVIAGDRLVLGKATVAGATSGGSGFVRISGDTMTGPLEITGSARSLTMRDSGASLDFWNGGTQLGYLQGNTTGLVLNSQSGNLSLVSSNGVIYFNNSLNAGTNTYGGVYRGLNWGSDYLIMSEGTNTFVSTPTTSGSVNLRGGINNAYGMSIRADGNHVLVGHIDHQGYNINVVNFVNANAYGFGPTDTDTYIDHPGDGRIRLISNGIVPFEVGPGVAAATGGLRLYAIGDANHYIQYSAFVNGAQMGGWAGCVISLASTGRNHFFFDDGRAQNDGGWIVSSSIDIKTNVNDLPVERAVDVVRRLRPVTYDMRDGSRSDQVGFIAEWTEDVAPHVVSSTHDGRSVQGIDYGRFAPLLTKALQHVLDRLDDIDQRLENQ